jgi:Fe-S cluster biogenesis protein NfuA
MPKAAKKSVKKNELFERIKVVFDERVRPFIQMDGGDMELVELTKEKVLKIKMQGACVGCSASSVTLEYGVQNMLFEEFPEEDIQLLVINQ